LKDKENQYYKDSEIRKRNPEFSLSKLEEKFKHSAMAKIEEELGGGNSHNLKK